MPLFLFYFIILTNLYCAKTLNIVLSFVIDVHFVMDVLVFSKIWQFPYPFGFCNPVWIYRRKINDDDDDDDDMQLTNGINSKLKYGFSESVNCLPFLSIGLWVCSTNICFVHSWTYFILKIYQLVWWQYYVYCIASLKNVLYLLFINLQDISSFLEK